MFKKIIINISMCVSCLSVTSDGFGVTKHGRGSDQPSAQGGVSVKDSAAHAALFGSPVDEPKPVGEPKKSYWGRISAKPRDAAAAMTDYYRQMPQAGTEGPLPAPPSLQNSRYANSPKAPGTYGSRMMQAIDDIRNLGDAGGYRSVADEADAYNRSRGFVPGYVLIQNENMGGIGGFNRYSFVPSDRDSELKDFRNAILRRPESELQARAREARVKEREKAWKQELVKNNPERFILTEDGTVQQENMYSGEIVDVSDKELIEFVQDQKKQNLTRKNKNY